MSTYWKQGSWNVICDRCGEKKKAEEVRQDWQGFIVCSSCYEPRHSLDFIRTKTDKQSVPFSRPRPPDVFVTVPYQGDTLTCTPLGSMAIPNYAIPNCMIPNNVLPGLL